jgi:hypothetical protein
MTYTKDNTAKLQEVIRDGKAIVESLEASKRELQARARERAAKIRRFAQGGKIVMYLFFWIVMEFALVIGLGRDPENSKRGE